MNTTKNTLAAGIVWEIISEGDELLLELHSIYGTVVFRAKGIATRMMVKDMLTTFSELQAQGPIEQDGSEAALS